MASPAAIADAGLLAERYRQVREQTLALIDGLSAEDTVVQSMPDVSPTKWHLAHVSWFFERFVLADALPGYRRFAATISIFFLTPITTRRGKCTRGRDAACCRGRRLPRCSTIGRTSTGRCKDCSASGPIEDDIAARITLGLNHEQQHQELLLTDIKHVLSCNPLLPAMRDDLPAPPRVEVDACGYDDGTERHRAGRRERRRLSAFDNETPRHGALLHPHRIGRPTGYQR